MTFHKTICQRTAKIKIKVNIGIKKSLLSLESMHIPSCLYQIRTWNLVLLATRIYIWSLNVKHGY